MTRITLLSILLLLGGAAAGAEIDYKKLYAQVAPGVVLVYGEVGKTGSIGTGSIIRDDGLVITNAHVIVDHDTGKPYEKLYIFTKPDRVTGSDQKDLTKSYGAKWVAYSNELDLALLRMVNPPPQMTLVQVSDDSNIGVGEATAAIGHPESGAKWSLTTGRIGGEFADFGGVKGKDVFQMETSLNRGNSGGPLLDGNGYMIGVNSSVARRAPDGLAITGVNFAIKSAVVRQWIQTVNQQIAAAPGPAAQGGEAFADEDAPPPPKKERPPRPSRVAKAQPPPLPAEVVPPPDAKPEPPKVEVAPPVQAEAARELPPPPPPAERGFSSATPPGQILSGNDLTKKHAAEAFDELDREAAKHR